MHMFDGYGMGYGHGIWGGIFMILVFALVLAGVVSLFRIFLNPDAKKPESAEDILKKRYANGEISKEAFDNMKKDLLE